MLEVLDNCDWKEAFNCAIESVYPAWPIQAESEVSLEEFTREDVEAIYASSEGENDGLEWLCYGRSKDGRYFLMTAWYDYTGWGCMDGGQAYVSNDQKKLIKFAMADKVKERLGLE